MEKIHAGEVLEELQPMGRTHAGAQEKGEEKGESEIKCYELFAISIHCHPAPLSVVGRGRRGRNEGVKLSLGRRRDGHR